MHCVHPSTMNVLKLKLPSSSLSVCSVSSMEEEAEEEAEEGKDGEEEGRNTVNSDRILAKKSLV